MQQLCLDMTKGVALDPFKDGKLHTLFKVELTSTDQQSTRPLESLKSKNINQLKTDLLPLWILELVDRYGIHQLGLSLARGRWEYDRWTEPIPEDWQGYPRGSEWDVTAASFSEGLFQQALPEWSSSIPLFPSSFWTGIIILSLG
ncbi:uncharacterized protein PGTG_17511 [Puccinia graminis f. sp. tritici CRL 75-36-700-3]|uniref:Uncharacterized protein n=1 Tax=Puccinia graminis f. sp. tritici (strain CRL 75-36-700-3 / race SCCL) TaxID=418459 RepID=E3L530_PUCGT|nr:uncharacterized protein PGTG_17511 [Puccinia graminis f. sp. tritici CRL 75-36-700-3]EFP91655.1 hypothetical protein PGTG_17511 [Puccinia graminis f. sp. tritici CRL 75-36-700-3]